MTTPTTRKGKAKLLEALINPSTSTGNRAHQATPDTCICWDSEEQTPIEEDIYTQGLRQTWVDVSYHHTRFKRIWLFCELCMTQDELDEKKTLGSNLKETGKKFETEVDAPYIPPWLLYFTHDHYFNYACDHIQKFIITNFKQAFLEKMIFCHDQKIRDNYVKLQQMEAREMYIPKAIPINHVARDFRYCTAKNHNIYRNTI